MVPDAENTVTDEASANAVQTDWQRWRGPVELINVTEVVRQAVRVVNRWNRYRVLMKMSAPARTIEYETINFTQAWAELESAVAQLHWPNEEDEEDEGHEEDEEDEEEG